MLGGDHWYLCSQGLIQCLVICLSEFFRIFIFVIMNNLINDTNYRSSFQWLISQEIFKVIFQHVQQNHRTILSQGTHGSRKWINNSRFRGNIQSNSYLVYDRPYQGENKGKQVASSTKCGLGDNVVLRLMECLTRTVNLIYLRITILHLFVFLSAYPLWN